MRIRRIFERYTRYCLLFCCIAVLRNPAQAGVSAFCEKVKIIHGENAQERKDSIRTDSLRTKSLACLQTTEAITLSQALLQHLSAVQKRDSLAIDSLVAITRKAHDDGLLCNSHLTAMMLLATSESAKKLLSAQNIIMFRLALRDTKLFFEEAKRYWDLHSKE